MERGERTSGSSTGGNVFPSSPVLSAVAVAVFGDLGNGVDFGLRMSVELFAFVFSVNSGLVVEILTGVGFLLAAIFAASAPNCLIARFCSALATGVFSFALFPPPSDPNDPTPADPNEKPPGRAPASGGGVLLGAGSKRDVGLGGLAVNCVSTPSASRSSSYSFHSSISSIP